MSLTKQKKRNAFFYASVCHICKQSCSDTTLQQCADCMMITYCSQEHQIEHWPEHKYLCRTIHYVRETLTEELSAYQGTTLMKFLMKEVRQRLNRTLQIYEVQMFKYAKMCLVCYKMNDELENCPRCMTVWFCAQHENKNHDSSTCDLLKLCFETSISLFQESAMPCLTNAYMRVASYEHGFSNMKEFINIYGDVKGIQSETSPHILEIKQSIRLTKPLTILYGMNVLVNENYIPTHKENKTELIFHVIAASKSELYTLREWEIFLHVFPTLLRLKLVLMGKFTDKFMQERKVCDNCVQKGKSYWVEWQNISYPHYVRIGRTFERPDLVIKFYNTYYEHKVLQELWISSLNYIVKHKCPLFLCHPHKKNMLNSIINTELSRKLEFRTYKNAFASLKPNKMRFDGDSRYYMVYENKYLTVYKTLCP